MESPKGFLEIGSGLSLAGHTRHAQVRAGRGSWQRASTVWVNLGWQGTQGGWASGEGGLLTA